MNFKKTLVLIYISLFLSGCWINAKKTKAATATNASANQLPPLPDLKKSRTAQIADFENKTGLKYLNYLERAMVPYLKEYLSQLKRIRIKKEFRIISNMSAINSFFKQKYTTRRQHAEIIFKILNNEELPDKYLIESYVKKRRAILKKIEAQKEALNLKNFKANRRLEDFASTEEGKKLNEEIKLRLIEIQKLIAEAAAAGRAYTTEEATALIENDPKIVELKNKFKEASIKWEIENNREASNANRINPFLSYSNLFTKLSEFSSTFDLSDIYLEESLKLNLEKIKKQKSTVFLGVSLFDFETNSSLTVDFNILDKRLKIRGFDYDDPFGAGNAIVGTSADIIITGRLEMTGGNLKIVIAGYERNLNKFLFKISKEYPLASFELTLQNHIQELSRDILNSISKVKTAPVMVRSTSDFSIVYLNGRDIGRTEVLSRGSDFSELFIPAVPVGYNYIEVVKRGYYKERGYIFIKNDANNYSVDFLMKKYISDLSLKVRAKPEGALIYVDLDLLDGNPAIATGLSEGMHKISVFAPGYEKKVISVNVIKGINNIVDVELAKVIQGELSPEELAKRYNFWKNFFFLGAIPMVGGLLYSALMYEHYRNKASYYYTYLSTLPTGSLRNYWTGQYNSSVTGFNKYYGLKNFFQFGAISAIALAGIFQYLESNAIDNNTIGIKIYKDSYMAANFSDIKVNLSIRF
jgi:hypothetical protein